MTTHWVVKTLNDRSVQETEQFLYNFLPLIRHPVQLSWACTHNSRRVTLCLLALWRITDLSVHYLHLSLNWTIDTLFTISIRSVTCWLLCVQAQDSWTGGWWGSEVQNDINTVQFLQQTATVKNLCLCSTEETVTYILDALGVIFFWWTFLLSQCL